MKKGWDQTWENDFRLTDASLAIWNPALITLREKGYDLGIYEPSDDPREILTEGDIGFWWANKNSHEFVASSPLELLGLVAIWEYRGDEWRRSSDPDIKDELLEETYPE